MRRIIGGVLVLMLALPALRADDEPKDIAPRLGISAKAASARMRRFKAKLGVVYSDLTTRIKAPH